MFTRRNAIALYTTLLIQAAQAQTQSVDPARIQLATETLQVMGLGITDRATKSFDASFEQQAKSSHLSAEQKKQMVDALLPLLRSQQEKLLAIRAHTMATKFTLDEMEKVKAIYSSTAGQKIANPDTLNSAEYVAASKQMFREFFTRIWATADGLTSAPSSQTMGLKK